MYFACIYENRRVKPVEIVLKRGRRRKREKNFNLKKEIL
jgi:hypothetical protein